MCIDSDLPLKLRYIFKTFIEKYGLGLSWGDLMIFAGTTAIKDMGGPVLGFCAGRVDDSDGTDSVPLGPTPYQEALFPCPLNGNCSDPLGASKIGLVYVDPQGHLADGSPKNAVDDIRNVFARMGMNDTETVALIGGGHSFGKCHGACPAGPGLPPDQDPADPWHGQCGTGKGADTYTSGIEGAWVTSPTVWSNEYFRNLVEYTWLLHLGPGGSFQWFQRNHTEFNIIMLTTDLALLKDKSYLSISNLFHDDIKELEKQFSHAWYKLSTRDMGPAIRCRGNRVPPAQSFQYPLPPPLPPSQLANFDDVKNSIKMVILNPNNSIVVPDAGGYGPLFVRLAWQCASTYRKTDYMGGCNGARIRFSPEKDWSANAFLDKALQLLQPVKDQYGDSLSWADLIVLSGNVGLELSNTQLQLPFIGGRTDAVITDPSTPLFLENRLSGGMSTDTIALEYDVMLVWGLSTRELVALMGAGHGMGGMMHQNRSGFIDGSWTSSPGKLSNDYFRNLLDYQWTIVNENSENIQYNTITTDGTTLNMLKTDLNLKYDPVYKAIVQEYAQDLDLFLAELTNAWTKIMTADLYEFETCNLSCSYNQI